MAAVQMAAAGEPPMADNAPSTSGGSWLPVSTRFGGAPRILFILLALILGASLVYLWVWMRFRDPVGEARVPFDDGHRALRRGEYEEAVAKFTEAIKLRPKLAEAYGNRGLAYLLLGKFDEAIADCNEAIRHDSQLSGAFVNRAIGYAQLERYDEAIADLDVAIRMNPSLVEAYVHRAIAFNETGRLDRAIEDCTEAIRRNPDLPIAYLNRGIAHEQKGDIEKANLDRESALRLNPMIEQQLAALQRPNSRIDPGQIECHLYIDTSRLDAFGLTLEGVKDALEKASLKIARCGERNKIPFLVLEGMPEAEALEMVVLQLRQGQSVRLRDVAEVRIVLRRKSWRLQPSLPAPG
jgi:tetratricopeptide (TPR) repeat protein